MVILGAGGSARAIAYEAHKRGAVVTLLNRDIQRAKTLSKIGEAKRLDQMSECSDAGYEFLINCTPVDLPIEPKDLLQTALIMDIRSKPKQTPLIKAALEKGCAVVYGYEMFMNQALGQFAIWQVS